MEPKSGHQHQQQLNLPPVLKAKVTQARRPLPRHEPFRPARPKLALAAPLRDEVLQQKEEQQWQQPQTEERSEEPAIAPRVEGELKVRQREKKISWFEEETVQDPAKRDVGRVLRNQQALTRREMYRRRLFPTDFEFAAAAVSEAEVVLGDRPNAFEALLFLLFLTAFIAFAALNGNVSAFFAVQHSLQQALENVPAAPSSTAYNNVSFRAAAAQPAAAAEYAAARLSPGELLQLKDLRTKTDVASWITDSLFAATAFPVLGDMHHICGPCLRLTVRRLRYTEVPDSPVGYTQVWPWQQQQGPSAAAAIPAEELFSEPELRNTAQSRFKWQYTFAPRGNTNAYAAAGGYSQTICAAAGADAQQLLQQHQLRSRYPPYFVPNVLISDRSTANVVVDFLSVEPLFLSTSYTAVKFTFDSAGALLPVEVETVSHMGSAGQSSSSGLRYGSVAIAALLLLLYTLYQYLKLRRMMMWKRWLTDWWNLFACAQVLLSLLCLLFYGLTFAAAGKNIPDVTREVTAEGHLNVFSDLLNTPDLEGQINAVAARVAAAAAARKCFLSVCAVTVLCGCLILIRYLQVWGGVSAKTLDWTLKKLLLPVMTCIVYMFILFLILVIIGNITLGSDTSAFSGFYKSLTTTAAFLLGGTAGNVDVFDLVDGQAVLAGFYFFPLFLLFSFFCFNVVISLILKTYAFCADEVQRSLSKHKNGQKEYYRTRYERLLNGVRSFLHALWTDIRYPGQAEKVIDISSDVSSEKSSASAKEAQKDDFNEPYMPPKYPQWMWQSLGLQNPYSQDPRAPVDFAALAAYQQQFGDLWGGAAQYGQQNETYYYYPYFYNNNAATQYTTYTQPPRMEKVHAVATYTRAVDREPAWRKVACLAFLCILFAAACLQYMLPYALNMQEAVTAALSRTTWTPPAYEILFQDDSLGLAPLTLQIQPQPREFFSIRSVEDLHAWLASDTGLIYFLRNTTAEVQYRELFPSNLAIWNGEPYTPFVISNWNVMLSPLPVRFRLQIDAAAAAIAKYPMTLGFLSAGQDGIYDYYLTAAQNYTIVHETLWNLGNERIFRDAAEMLSISFSLYNNNQRQNQYSICDIKFKRVTGRIEVSVFVPTMGLQPYNLREGRSVSVALQGLILLFILYFLLTGVIDFFRFCKSFISQRPDSHLGVAIGVYFCDSLFNTLDLWCLIVIFAAATAWLFYALSSTHTVVFTNGLSQYVASGAVELMYAALNNLLSAASAAQKALDAYTQLCAALVVLSCLRFLRLFEKRKRIVIFFFTVYEALAPLFYVFLVTFFLYIGFSFTCYLAFGSHVACFSTLRKSFVATFLLLVGYFPTESLFIANQTVAALLVFPALFLVGIVCLGCFLAVLLRSFIARVAEVEAAEASLLKRYSRSKDFDPQRNLADSCVLCCKELLCLRAHILDEEKSVDAEETADVAALNGPAAQALQQQQQREYGGVQAAGGGRFLGDEDESQDEFAEMQRIDLLARKAKQKPVKVADLPKEVVTTQLTDAQWHRLPARTRAWAASEVENFNDFFRKLHVLSALAGSEKLPFVQQTEKDLYEQLTALDIEVQQQESLLRNRVANYRTRLQVEQQKIANYTKYLEQALEDRGRELEMLNAEFALLQSKAEEANTPEL